MNRLTLDKCVVICLGLTLTFTTASGEIMGEELVYVVPMDYKDEYSYFESDSPKQEEGVDYQEFVNGVRNFMSDVSDTLLTVPENVGKLVGSAGNMVASTVMNQYEEMKTQQRIREEEKRNSIPIVKYGKPITIKKMVKKKKKESPTHFSSNRYNNSFTEPIVVISGMQQLRHGIKLKPVGIRGSLGPLPGTSSIGTSNTKSGIISNSYSQYTNGDEPLAAQSISYDYESPSQPPSVSPPIVYFDHMSEPIEKVPSILQQEYSYRTIEPVSTPQPQPASSGTSDYYRWSPPPPSLLEKPLKPKPISSRPGPPLRSRRKIPPNVPRCCKHLYRGRNRS